jgi:protein phosphatase-4 regulatory subunit 3
MRFREFIHSVSFRNVLQAVDSEFLVLVHRNYRLQYLKDTALARCLDENCIGFLTNYQLSQWNETIGYVNRSVDLRKALIEQLKELKVEAFELLGELGTVAKSVAAYTRLEFYDLLCADDILHICTKAVRHAFPEPQAAKVKVVISDLAACLITLAPARVRDFFTSETQREGSGSLLQSVAQAMLASKEISVIQQISELFHSLLDPNPEKRLSDVTEVFYDTVIPSLIAALKTSSLPDEETRLCLMEILSILSKCVLYHTFRIRFILLSNEAFAAVAGLLELQDKPLTLAVIRLFKAVMEKNDQFLIRHIVSVNSLQRVWQAFLENGERENMLFSSILALIHAIKIASNPLVLDHIQQRHLILFATSPLLVYFEGWTGKSQHVASYSLWNPREISAKEDEAYFESSDEEPESLKRKLPVGEPSEVAFEKKTKVESSDE